MPVAGGVPSTPSERLTAVEAMLRQVEVLRADGADAAAVAVQDEMIGEFGTDVDAVRTHQLVAGALTDRAQRLFDRDLFAAAATRYDRLIDRYADSPDPVVQQLVASAVTQRTAALTAAGLVRGEPAGPEEPAAVDAGAGAGAGAGAEDADAAVDDGSVAHDVDDLAPRIPLKFAWIRARERRARGWPKPR